MLKLAKLFMLVAVLGLLVVGCSENQNPLISDDTPQTAVKDNGSRSLADGVLESATLHIYARNVSNQVVNVHRVINPWMENIVTWNNFGGAYTSEIYASFTVSTVGWYEVDITNLVAGWMNGTFENYGLLLAQNEFSAPRTFFNSTENYLNPPYLEICYTDGSLCEDTMAIADALINEYNPDFNYGSGDDLITGAPEPNELEKQALLKFYVEPGQQEEGCTLTIGFWKTHAGFGPQPDMVTALLPIWLGDEDGDRSLNVTTNKIAVNILCQHVYGHPSNGITKLYAQLLGAKLNIVSGAGYSVVADIIDDADAFLADHNWTDWKALVDAESDWVDSVMYWHKMLDDYNNGLIGPGHCDDDVISHYMLQNRHRHHHHAKKH